MRKHTPDDSSVSKEVAAGDGVAEVDEAAAGMKGDYSLSSAVAIAFPGLYDQGGMQP